MLDWLTGYKTVISSPGGAMWLHYLLVQLTYRCVLHQFSEFGRARRLAATACWQIVFDTGLLHQIVLSERLEWQFLVEQVRQVKFTTTGSKRGGSTITPD